MALRLKVFLRFVFGLAARVVKSLGKENTKTRRPGERKKSRRTIR